MNLLSWLHRVTMTLKEEPQLRSAGEVRGEGGAREVGGVVAGQGVAVEVALRTQLLMSSYNQVRVRSTVARVDDHEGV